MRKNLLSLSIAAMIGGLGFAGAASAGVSVLGAAPLTATTATNLQTTPDGIGHILVVPYFSTQNGNSTLLSIVNTDTTNGKAVKVRFRGAANSDDIFDFQLYMSPGDVWLGNVSQGADGRSAMFTTDNTCTLPPRSALNVPFVMDRLPPIVGAFTAANRAEWTREGYVEILTMANIPPLTPGAATANPLFTAIKHAAGVAPGCPSGELVGSAASPGAASAALWQLNADPTVTYPVAGTLLANVAALGFDSPTGSLMGSATIINVAGASVAWSGNDEAIVANTGVGTVAAPGRVVFSPQTNTPVPAANVTLLTGDPILRAEAVTTGTGVVARNFDFPDLSTPYASTVAVNTTTSPSTQANLIGASLAVTSVSNEYLTNPVLSAQTDWVFTFPTRRYSVAMNYNSGGVAGTNALMLTATADGSTVSPYFTSSNVVAQSTGSNLACVTAGARTYIGLDEQIAAGPSTGFVISPGGVPSVTPFRFCGESYVLGFSGALPTTVLSSNVAAASIAPTIATDGWMNILTPGATATGLPILGAAYEKATGPLVAGKSSNFGVALPHRATR